MTTGVTLKLDNFSRAALDRLAERGKGSDAKAVRAAVLYYLADRDSNRPAWRAPRWSQGRADATQDLEIELDDDTWRALSDEAAQQEVSPDFLALAALLYYVADLDSGRVAERLGDALPSRESPRFRR
jgi:predicted transcriptional regulator